VAHESLGDKNQEDRAFGETSKQLESIVVRWTKRAKALKAVSFFGQNILQQ